METIFHEKQEGSLCAQHCLNALLQNQYFSAVDLAQIGQRLDETERDRMAEGGIGTNEYQRFIEEPSSNFDDSGFFSVQVITEALSVWGLDIVLFNSQDPVAVLAREDPTKMSAFICNYHQHWFCIRKLGLQWFNLNSLLSGPELISDTYLSLFLTQLQQEGYSIFIVTGNLPECEADQLLRLMPAIQTVKPSLLTEKETEADVVEDDDRALKEALRASKELIDKDDAALQRALQMSLEGYSNELSPKKATSSLTGASSIESPSTSKETLPVSQEELRNKRIAFLSKQQENTVQVEQGEGQVKQDEVKQGEGQVSETDWKDAPAVGQLYHSHAPIDLSEEELLKQAIAMSMEHS